MSGTKILDNDRKERGGEVQNRRSGMMMVGLKTDKDIGNYILF